MNKLITSTIVAVSLLGGLVTTVPAHAKQTKWTTGTPKSLHGFWRDKVLVRHQGNDTILTDDAMILSSKWFYVMYDHGSDYGGNHLAYRKVGHTYHIRAYDKLEKSWSYTKLKRQGHTLALQRYGTRKVGKAFKAHTTKTYHLTYQAKASARLAK